MTDRLSVSASPAVPALFTATVFLGAVLAFLMQPAMAKMILPLFGGSPSVWNTCMLFFQAALLCSYAYAHALTSSRHSRGPAIAHLALMALAAATLPIAASARWAPAPGTDPALWLLWLLIAAAGPAFFIVAATAPLVQRWLSMTGHASARDPYFLYAASNTGSLAALLAFPFLLEPRLDTTDINRIWTAGYAALGLLVAGCAAATQPRRAPDLAVPVSGAAHPVPAGSRLRWFMLAFVPSSLLLAVTRHLSTDVAAVPMLWVVPLSLYLATYALAFARRRVVPQAALERAMPLLAVMLAIALLARDLELPASVLFPLHLGALFVIALACHGQLADRRPDVSHLTRYYLWIAVGGLAGGVFNALLAPLLFTGLAEYPVTLVLACLMRRAPAQEDRASDLRSFVALDVVPAVLVGVLVLVLVHAASALGLGPGREAVGLTVGVPAVVCYLMLARPVRFALALAALFTVHALLVRHDGELLFERRTYFGVHAVRREGGHVRLFHGRTVHGIQSAGHDRAPEPLGYYHRSGPAGSVLRALDASARPPVRVGVIGLGVGSLAAYSRPGQHWTFFELDPTVLFLARDSGHFTHWRAAPAHLEAVLGDARLNLRRGDDAPFDLLVLDAFNSDAVPVHLLTREALSLYRQRLAPGGTLLFHVSNRYLDVAGVVASLVRDAGLEALEWADLDVSASQRAQGKLPSHWVVVPGHAALFRRLRASAPWQHLVPGDAPVWTDRFSDVPGALHWLH